MVNSRKYFGAAVFLLASMGVGSVRLPAREAVLQLDPGQTRIEFTLPSTLHTVHGTFKLNSGTMRFDSTGKADGKIIVDAASGNSGVGMRDKRMNRSVLESDKYPQIVFTPDRVAGQLPAAAGPFQMSVHGLFWLHGQSHEMTLEVKGVEAKDSLTASTQLVIPYVNWGLKNPSTLFLRVSKQVQININTVARITLSPVGQP